VTRLVTAIAAVCATIALAACGTKEETTATPGAKQRVDLVLDYFPNADHAPIYAAQAIGAFEQAGLDVRIRTPSDPAAPLKLVAGGQADIAISYEPEVLLARDKGLRVASVAALVQKPLTSLMAIAGSKVRKVADLEGKTVGTAGIPYQSAYLTTLLKAAGVPRDKVKEINVGFNLVPAMLSKKVDATLGAFWNYEGVQLRRAKKRPAIVRMEQAGLPTYSELVFVARQEDLQRRGDLIRRFVQAVGRGAEAVRKNPSAGVDPLLAANQDLDRGLQTASVRETLPVFFPADAKRPWGWQNPLEWRRFGDWMLENGLIRQPAAPTALTNEYLAGQGV
jgi:putative hydroxymethylpyrimidine transport system substrate-binding protein